ncbi:MAG TPA: dethiobiotin synthase [Corynebacteriales bacterium]|nr:dethiobiotin synthase [Mycobacteriales bacterium]
MRIIFVTGTNTDVGKTVATASAVAATHSAQPDLKIGVIKPAQTGVTEVSAEQLGEWESGDRGDLAAIRTLIPSIPLVVDEFVRYPEPLAPDLAARRAKMPLYPATVFADAIRKLARNVDVLFVEGAGGLLVGLGESSAGEPVTVLTIAQEVARDTATKVSFLLVSQPDLGMLNHCLLSVREIERAGVPCDGIVLGTWPTQPDLAMMLNQQEVTRVTNVPVIARIPSSSGSTAVLEPELKTIVESHSSDWWQQLPWLA